MRHVLPLVLILLCAAASRRVRAEETVNSAPQPSPFSDFRTQAPGTVHRIGVSDLPPPDMSNSPDNGPSMIPRPASAWPKVPPGFKVDLYATGLKNPRLMPSKRMPPNPTRAAPPSSCARTI
jgi:hypothetical protein